MTFQAVLAAQALDRFASAGGLTGLVNNAGGQCLGAPLDMRPAAVALAEDA